jgi:class 3 adenylate cyclase/tetratricopeptide (TPR) repeat protein
MIQKSDELSQVIAALEAQRAVLGDEVVEAALAPLREKLAELEQEQAASRRRRLVTVLFLDIVNSTLLSQGLEPEEVQEIMGGALKRLSAPIEIHGGQVTQFVGDGFVAVFGLTTVRENDARQAVRAGLSILDEARACAQDLERRFHLQGFNIRIGINTGRVVPGRFAEAESPVMGLTVSLAARMEQSALPGSLFISQFTHQHIRGAFEVEPLPPVTAKGFPQPVTVYRVRGARPRTFLTFTRGVEGIRTGLIGREAELHQLKEVLTGVARSGRTRLVTIIGEAGVGKSRLLHEFDRWVALDTSRVTAFKSRASPQRTAVPFGLLREMIAYRLGLLVTDPVPLTRQRLVQGLSAFLEDEAEMKSHFVGSLLGFDFSDSPYLQGVLNDPAQLRERAQLYLAGYLAAVSRISTTVLMLDDLHWADTPSLAFIDRLVRERPDLSLMVVGLARPTLSERVPGWGQAESGSFAGSLRLDLEPLSRQASRKLLGEILHNVEALPDSLTRRILDSADGNPFYLEEYIQALVDSRVIHRVKRGTPWTVDLEKLGKLEMPSTLTALLEARLDSLNNAQRVLLQQAAVIGRVFWRSALQALSGGSGVSEADLKALEQHGFIVLQETSTFAGSEEYRFHHGLMRDAAYEMLVKPDRQRYHAQAAEWLVGATGASGRTGEFAPLIAGHFESGGDPIRSAEWYIQSGTRARNQGDPAQARLFFDRALELLPAEERSRRWQALAGRDEVLNFLGDSEARMADDEALVVLAESIGEDPLRAEAYYRRGYTLGMSGKYAEEREAYLIGLQAALRAGDHRREALLLGLMVMCEVRLGDFSSAARTVAAALECAEQLGDELVTARTLTNASTFYTEAGDLARAAQLLERQLEIMRRTGNIEGEVAGLTNLGYTCILLGRPQEAIPALRRGIQLAQAIGHRSFAAYCRLNLALAVLRGGDPLSALEELEHCLPELQVMNDRFGVAVGQEYAAFAKEQAGQAAAALAGFEQAAAALDAIGASGSLQDARAGAARCRLVLNEIEKARELALPLWDFLQQQAGAGMEFPLRGFETCADVFHASGQQALARQAVESGNGELMARAEKISLPEWRASFLEQVPEHRRLQARLKEINQLES